MQIYGNELDESVWKSCLRARDRYARKFGYREDESFSYTAFKDPFLGDMLGIMNLLDQAGGKPIDPKKSVVIGSIRMGFGHYRMGLAAVSAARSLGYTPYWLDYLAVKDSTASKIIDYLNTWYSIASRMSQRSKAFNRLWEKATSEWSRPITYHAKDIALTELFKNVCAGLPKDIPYIASHPWCAQAAVHAGMTNVVTMIPDNWPLSFHLAEGSTLAVQSSSTFIGYRELRNMGPKGRILKPIPEGQIRYTGHYIDHELVSNIDEDCGRRLARMRDKKPRRFLMSIGGAGAQQVIIEGVVRHLMPLLREKKLLLCVNMGDHEGICAAILKNLGYEPGRDFTMHDDWAETRAFAKNLLTRDATGLHVFLFKEKMPAVYTTNLLMRGVDVMLTKPSELAFYPVPKLFVQRVGRFEAWGAIRGAEIGDGTMETDTLDMLYQTLNVLINDRDLLALYCDNIMKNARIGIYDGAYNLIKIIEEKKAEQDKDKAKRGKK